MEENQQPIEHEHVEEHEFDDHEMDTSETAIAAYNRIDALIDLLVKKGLITEEEIDEAEESLFLDEEEEGEDEGPQEPAPSQGFTPGFGQ